MKTRNLMVGGAAIALAVVFGGLALTGDADEIAGEPVSWFDSIAPPTDLESSGGGEADAPELIYLDVVSEQIPDASDADLLLAGRSSCAGLTDAVVPVDDAYADGLAIGLTVTWPDWSTYQAQFVVGAAIATWCPQFDYLGGTP